MSWLGKLLDNRDLGTGNKLMLWLKLILEGLGWVDEPSGEKKAAWLVLPLLEGAGNRRLLHQEKMKGAVYNPAKGRMSRDMKSSGKYLKNVNTKVEEELFSMLRAWN